VGVSRYIALSLAVAAVVALFSVEKGATTPASHSFPSFFTPGKVALCNLIEDISGENSFVPYLNCWRPRDGFTITLESTGRPLYGPLKANKGPVQSLTLPRWLLPFGESWWANRRGDEGRGRRGNGRVLFRCTSRTDGLTCRSVVSDRGFSLGRVRGYRIF
jgi:hypothetical protein